MEFSPGMYLSDRRTGDPFHSQLFLAIHSTGASKASIAGVPAEWEILGEAKGCNQAGVLRTRQDEKTLYDYSHARSVK